jgi:hypothetical protein
LNSHLITSRKKTKVATVARKKARKLAVIEDMIRGCTERIKLLCFLLVLALISACTGEDPTIYKWEHGEYVAKIYADMEEIGRINEKYMEAGEGYIQYAMELAEVLHAMENHLLEFRQFLKDNREELLKAGINVTESEAWVESQLHLTGEIAQGIAIKLEKKGYQGEILNEFKRLGKYAERSSVGAGMSAEIYR